MGSASSHIRIRPLAGVLLLGLVGACGMPQATEPASPPPLASEAAPVLLGGVEEEAKIASAAPSPARRPGWGTMAPIANPPTGRELAAAEPAYRLIGPTLPEPDLALASRATARSADKTSAPVRNKPRIRHWIVPVKNTR